MGYHAREEQNIPPYCLTAASNDKREQLFQYRGITGDEHVVFPPLSAHSRINQVRPARTVCSSTQGNRRNNRRARDISPPLRPRIPRPRIPRNRPASRSRWPRPLASPINRQCCHWVGCLQSGHRSGNVLVHIWSQQCGIYQLRVFYSAGSRIRVLRRYLVLRFTPVLHRPQNQKKKTLNIFRLIFETGVW